MKLRNEELGELETIRSCYASSGEEVQGDGRWLRRQLGLISEG
jgi:hypothetical protein